MSINEIEPVLRSIIPKGSVIHFTEYNTISNYEAEIRANLLEGESPSQKCDIWIKKFDAVTNSKWIVKNTAPYAVRLLYKKTYTCKNKNCRAKINIVFKKDNRNTRKNDPLLEQGLTAVIKISYKHNHSIYCPIPQPPPTKKLEDGSRIDTTLPELIYTNDNINDDNTDMNSSKISPPSVGTTEHLTELSLLKEELTKIVKLVEQNNSLEMTQGMINFRKTLEGVNQDNLIDFFLQFK